MALYEETPEAGNDYRREFLRQADALIQRRYAHAEHRRYRYFRPDFTSIQAYQASLNPYRKQLKALLGWPLTQRDAPIKSPAVRSEIVAEDDLGVIQRLWIEVFTDFELYGLLFLPPESRSAPRPLVLAQHGGLGTPELCSGFFDSANYNDMTRRVLRRGAVVFAPQLFRWDERFGPVHDFHAIDRQLQQVGGSIAALEITCLQTAIDHLTQRKDVADDRVGMVGLSYGGFHTLFAAAIDPRIHVALVSCWVRHRQARANGTWVWFDQANLFFDPEVAALVCPRPLYIEAGTNDELVDAKSARREVERIQGFYRSLSIEDRFRFKEHPGGHEFDPADDGIDFLCHHLGLP